MRRLIKSQPMEPTTIATIHNEITERGAKPVIPPRKDAVIWQYGNCKAQPHPQDKNLRSIAQAVEARC